MGKTESRTERDVREFEAFFRANIARTVAAAGRVTLETAAAEDAAIEAMAKAHARWHRLKEDPRRNSWVLKVAINEALERMRRQPVPTRAEDFEDFSDHAALRVTLARALASLAPRQREVLVLRYLVGMSEPEVASAMDLSLGTVKTHVRRGLVHLRSALGPTLKEELSVQLV